MDILPICLRGANSLPYAPLSFFIKKCFCNPKSIEYSTYLSCKNQAIAQETMAILRKFHGNEDKLRFFKKSGVGVDFPQLCMPSKGMGPGDGCLK